MVVMMLMIKVMMVLIHNDHGEDDNGHDDEDVDARIEFVSNFVFVMISFVKNMEHMHEPHLSSLDRCTVNTNRPFIVSHHQVGS